MRMKDNPGRNALDMCVTDETFVYRNEIIRLQRELADAKTMIKHHQDRTGSYKAALEFGGERTKALEDVLRECTKWAAPDSDAYRRAAALLVGQR